MRENLNIGQTLSHNTKQNILHNIHMTFRYVCLDTFELSDSNQISN